MAIKFSCPYIDSEVNHNRYFIKIPFIYKGMEFIDLHSILKDNLEISSIPNYFNLIILKLLSFAINKTKLLGLLIPLLLDLHLWCQTVSLVSWVKCGTSLYRFLIFAPLLTSIFNLNKIVTNIKIDTNTPDS